MELIIYELYDRMECKIYLKEKRGNQTIIIGYDGNFLVEYTLPNSPAQNGTDIKPLLTIPFFMKDALIKAFINEGAKQNLRTENENLLKGKLTATELHLKDMREISQKLIDKCTQ